MPRIHSLCQRGPINLPVGPQLSPEQAGDVKSLIAAAQAGLLPHPIADGVLSPEGIAESDAGERLVTRPRVGRYAADRSAEQP